MKVKVLFFAKARDVIGKREMYVDFEGEKVEDLIRHIMVHFPKLGSLKFSVAVNREFVMPDHPLKDEDEVAIIPPVSGG